MDFRRGVVFLCLGVAGATFWGCGSSPEQPPTQEAIQQQLKEDAAMRAEEDRLEKEASGASSKR